MKREASWQKLRQRGARFMDLHRERGATFLLEFLEFFRHTLFQARFASQGVKDSRFTAAGMELTIIRIEAVLPHPMDPKPP